MKHKLVLFVAMVTVTTACWGQSKPRSTTAAAKTSPASTPLLNVTELNSTLASLEQVSRQTTYDLSRLRVDKWKTDGSNKDQIESNVRSLMGNMGDALPGMISATRSAPTSLSANLKLYRDLNVLYEVLAPLTDSAGAFGSKDEYQMLSTDTQLMEANRHALTNYMESLAAFQDAELVRLHGKSAPAATSSSGKASPAPTPAKKGPVIVMGANGVPKRIVDAGGDDDSDTPRKPAHKKTPAPTPQPTPQGAH